MDPEVVADFNVEFDSSAIHNENEKIKGGSHLFDFQVSRILSRLLPV